MVLRMIDLFAGTGAFSLVARKYNIQVVFANDVCKESETIYNRNNDHSLRCEDINTIDVSTLPTHDILTGGFPCQPFSVAGKRNGFQDVRSNVFWKILEILDYHKPKYIVLENVKNLKTHNNSQTFSIIKDNLVSRGYYLTYKILNTAEITGVPHHRERIYIVGVKSSDIHNKFDLSFPIIPKQPISAFLETNVPNKYYYTIQSKIYPLLKQSVIDPTKFYQYRRVYVRENKSGECPTLTANMGLGGHNVPIILDNIGIRKLTPRECFNLQGFPRDYVLPNLADSHLYKLAGNAVSVPVVQLIFNKLIPLIDSVQP